MAAAICLSILQPPGDFAGVESGVGFSGGVVAVAFVFANAWQIFIHVSCLQEIAVCNAGAVAVLPHNAASYTAAACADDTDAAGVVAVADATAADRPHNAAGKAAADLSGVVAVCDAAAAVKPYNAAADVAANDFTGVVAICDGAVKVLANNAADINVADAALGGSGGDGDGAGAICDAAAVVVSNDAADIDVTGAVAAAAGGDGDGAFDAEFCTVPVLPTKPKRP